LSLSMGSTVESTGGRHMRMDSKVHGTLIRNRDGREIPEDEFIVFRPSDNAVPRMLEFYRNLLVLQGASEE
jgi:hypothetical protein